MIFTEEQQKVIELCKEFIRNGKSEEWFTINGKAGTGKTTIIKEVLKEFPLSYKIISALSHKAKKVIVNSLGDGISNYKPCTIAGMLGMVLDHETGKFTKSYNSIKIPPISDADILVVDEASMVNEEALELILRLKPKHCKIIFLGDIGQLEPIRDDEKTTHNDKVSPIFETKNKGLLTNRIRQGEGHPVLEYADYYWENSQTLDSKSNPIPSNIMVDTIIGNKKLLFHKSIDEIIDFLEEKYREVLKTDNTNIVKIITYTNKTKTLLNEYFHNKLFFNKDAGTTYEYNNDEIIIFNDNYEIGKDIIIENSSEFKIKNVSTKIEKINDEFIKIFCLTIVLEEYNNMEVVIKVLSSESKKIYSTYISDLFEKAKSLPLENSERKKAIDKVWDDKRKNDLYIDELFKKAQSLPIKTKKRIDAMTFAYSEKEKYKKHFDEEIKKAKDISYRSNEREKAMSFAWEEKKKYANIDYAYALTSHKSQGSTYDFVVVHETDILGLKSISNITKSRSLYTALTRAKYEVHVV